MSPDLKVILDQRGIVLATIVNQRGLEQPCWLCNHCGMGDLDKWNHIIHAPECRNRNLVAERYAEVESRPKTPSVNVNPNGDASIKCMEESNNGGNAVGN